MQKMGIKAFGFICHKIDSKEAMDAYRVFAEELEGIAGMLAVQYSPYNGGYGKVFWVKDRKGNDIPVISARGQIWANQEKEKSGTPSQIAAVINEDATNKIPEGEIAWTIVHAWSRFEKESKDSIVSAPQNSRSPRGVTPVYWCKQLLDKKVQVVPVDELLWRLRIKHINRDSAINSN